MKINLLPEWTANTPAYEKRGTAFFTVVPLKKIKQNKKYKQEL
jgi:hypothetical protein